MKLLVALFAFAPFAANANTPASLSRTNARAFASPRRARSGLQTRMIAKPGLKREFLSIPTLPSQVAVKEATKVKATNVVGAGGGKPSLKQRLLAFRKNNRDVLSEFLGTFTLMFLGTAVNCAAAMGQTNTLGVAVGWAFSIAMAVYVAGGVSDAHLNPSVTFSFALLKGFPWRKVLPYVVAQFLGAFAGSGLAFLDHKTGLDALDQANNVVRATTGKGATAGIFATYPASHVGVAHAFGDEVLTTAALLMCVSAIGDSKNMAPKGNVGPLIVGGLVSLLILGFGGITGVAMNPARDLAPRVMTYLAGWGNAVFTAGNNYWWIPIVAPLIGAPIGVATYNAFIDSDSNPEPKE